MVLKKKSWMSTFAVGTALAVALTGTVTAHAATAEVSAISQKNVETAFESSSPTLKNGDIVPSASWGQLILYWNGKENANATLKTFNGIAYCLQARISGYDGLGYIPSKTSHGNYTSSITTQSIFSRTTSSSVTWDAYGEIVDTYESGIQTATVSETIL